MRLYEVAPITHSILLVDGRDDINELILEMYYVSEDFWGKAKERVSKFTDFVNKAAKRLQDTEPVIAFDQKVDELITRYRATLGEDHPAVKAARTLSQIGTNHPKKTAFIIGVLSGLASVLGSPAAGMVLGGALRTAVGLAKGERASTAIGKAAAVAGTGVLAGAAASQVADALASVGHAAIDIVRDAVEPLGTGFLKIQHTTTINGKTFNFSGIIPRETWEKLETLKSRIPSMNSPEFAQRQGTYLSIMDKYFNNSEMQAHFADLANERGIEIDKRTLMKGKVSQIANIIKAISGGMAGGVLAAKVEKGSTAPENQSMIQYVSKIAQTLSPREIALVISAVQRAG
jgi:hypothetical protein